MMKWNLPVSHVRSTKISILIILFYMSECIAYGRHIIITELIYLILLVFFPFVWNQFLFPKENLLPVLGLSSWA